MKISNVILTISLVGIVSILIIIAVAFYWTSVRESKMKSDCYYESTEKAKEKGKREGAPEGHFSKSDYDTYYGWCLQGKGL